MEEFKLKFLKKSDNEVLNLKEEILNFFVYLYSKKKRCCLTTFFFFFAYIFCVFFVYFDNTFIQYLKSYSNLKKSR